MMNIDPGWLANEFRDLSGLAPLGSGGCKAVYSAIHPVDGDVVLKIIKPVQDTEDVRREILAVEQVQSPRVPRILAHGVTNNTALGSCYWLREQRIIGHPVDQYLRQNGPMPPHELFNIGIHVLEALVMAEAANIVHRDVKPANIIRDSSGSYWLLDFGIARHLTLDSLTATSLPFGRCTPGYAPPEQFRNMKPFISARTDLFSLGITLYECATGANPFIEGTRDQQERMRRVAKDPLPSLSLSFPGANLFCDLVSAMTQKRPDQRPTSAGYALEWIRDAYRQYSSYQ